MSTLYGAPLGAHFSARRAWPPLSGLMYQVSVGTSEPEPHAATTSARSDTETTAAWVPRFGSGLRADHRRGIFILGAPIRAWQGHGDRRPSPLLGAGLGYPRATPDAPWALPTARTRAVPNRRFSRVGCDQPRSTVSHAQSDLITRSG